MRTIVIVSFILLVCACGNKKPGSIELIQAPMQQDSLFRDLMTVTQQRIPATAVTDSLAFLILPVQASCPACRKKTIDSIVKHKDALPTNHYIIISATGGRKTIRGYFREQDHELPIVEGRVFLDSTNLAYKRQLYKDKPTIYYAFNQKAYKKVAAIPATVRDDLREFFSGYR